MTTMRDMITDIVTSAIKKAVDSGEIALTELPKPSVERPRDPSHGDWATSVALKSAKAAGMSPRDLAGIIASHIEESSDINSVEIAGPGFINIRLAPHALHRILVAAHEEGNDFGKVDYGKGEYVQIEFVSANPVGPMHVGHGRWAALGDAMGAVMEHGGYRIQREFLLNDEGVQMNHFATSVSARYMQLCGHEEYEVPENGYKGAYVIDIAQEILDDEGDGWAEKTEEEREKYFLEKAYHQVVEHLKEVLESMGVIFDEWFSERTLHARDESGECAISRTIDAMREQGHVYDKDGAVWFKSTEFGDDKDRVVQKSDGTYTYFAADIAYHHNKFLRGFDRVINIWGADHHGYVPRMMAAVAALGYPGQLEIVLGQLVSLYRNGEMVRMSKRTGEMVTLEELLEEVGSDATKFFYLRHSTDQHVDFDIDLAVKKSNENPLYYVQYAHARICSILRKAAGVSSDDKADVDGIVAELIAEDTDLSPLTADAELALMRKLSEFSDVVEIAARDRAPSKLTYYAEELASAFHHFYAACRVIDEENKELTAARLYAVDATRQALRTVLTLIGVDSPTVM